MGMGGSLAAEKIGPEKAPLSWRLQNTLRRGYLSGWLGNHIAKLVTFVFGIPTLTAELQGKLIRADGTMLDYGTLGYKVVTTAFAEFVVDQLQTETSVFGDFKYHDSGVGVTAEAAGNTDIETTDGESRATGTQTEGTSVQYQSVGTIAYTTTKAITEHGLFNASTGVTLMDRTVFSAINVVNGDSIQFTYTLTVSAGS
jgi:hypothetical protein